MFANCRNESRTSVSTLVVAFSVGPIFRFGEADMVGAKARLVASLECSGSDTPLTADAGCGGAIVATGRRLVCSSAPDWVGTVVGMV